MTKTQLKSEIYDLLKTLESSGITVQGSASDIISHSPLITYDYLDKDVKNVQNRVERWITYYIIVNIYGKNSVECTTISDDIDSILKPVGFQETGISSKYDNDSKKHKLTSIYAIDLDESGCTYNMI